MLEECIDKQFLLCLLTLLRNLFTEKDREILLPMFDTNRLLTVGSIWKGMPLND